MSDRLKQFDDLKVILSKPESYNIVYLCGVNQDTLSEIEYFINSQKINFFSIMPEKLKEINFEVLELPSLILLNDIEYFVRNPDEEIYLIYLIEKCLKERRQLLISGKFQISEMKLSEKVISYLKHILTIKFDVELKKENHFKEIIKSIEPDIPEVKPENNIVEELREEYKAKMYIWKMKGFNTSRIENVIDGNIDEITSEFVSFTADIQRLIDLQKRYGILELKMIPEKEKFDIEKKLFDPDSVSELEYKISFYEKRSTLRNQFKLIFSWDESIRTIETDESNSEIINFLNIFAFEPFKYKGLNLLKGERGYGKSTYLNITGIQLFENFKTLVIAYITPHSILSIDDFLNDLSYWDIAIIDDIDKVLFRYQKLFTDDVLNIIVDMPVLATFSSKGFIDTIEKFEPKNYFEIKEPGIKIKRKMLEKIVSDKDLIKKVEPLLNNVKGGFYDIENLVANFYYDRKEGKKTEKPFEETKEIFKEEKILEQKDITPEIPEKIEIQEKTVEVTEVKSEEVKEEKKIIKKLDSVIEGIALDVENYGLRIQKEI